MTRLEHPWKVSAACGFAARRWSALIGAGFVAGIVASLSGCGTNVPQAELAEARIADHVALAEPIASIALQDAEPPAGAAADWPCFLGPQHDNTVWPPSAWSGKLKPREIWRRNVGEGYSSPVIRGRRLVLLTREADEEIVECMDAATGKSLWRFSYPTTFRCSVSYSSGPYATPAIVGDRVVTVGAQGQVHCVDLARGGLLWKRLLHEDYQVEPYGYYPVAASPRIEDGRIYINLGAAKTEAGLVALDLATGATIWTATHGGASYSTPVLATIHGRAMLLAQMREELVAVDPESGKTFWSVPFAPRKPDAYNTVCPLVAGDLVMISCYCLGSRVLRVRPDGGQEPVWADGKTLDSQYNNLTRVGSRVVGLGSLDGSLKCLDLGSGQLVWRQRWRSGRGAWSLRFGDRLLLWGERGHLGRLDLSCDPPKLELMRDTLLDGPCFPAPAFSQGRLYLRNDDTLLCVEP